MREIVVCGEALVDVVQSAVVTPSASVAETGALPSLAPALGGGPFNVAVTIGRLGGAVSFCSVVSTDAYGEAIITALGAAGVDTTPVTRRPEPTSLALATIGGIGLWAAVITLPVIQQEFGIDRSGASLPYTMTMIGFATGGGSRSLH